MRNNIDYPRVKKVAVSVGIFLLLISALFVGGNS